MLKHIAHYAPAKIVPGLVNFLGLIIYARIFTKEEYGRYAYVLAIIGLIQSVLFPWIRLSLLRYYQKHKEKGNENKYIHYTLYLTIIISLVLIIGWCVYLKFNDSNSTIKLLLTLGLPLMILNAIFEQFMALSRAKLDSKSFAINNILMSVLKLGFVLLLVYLFHLNEIAIFISIIITNTILIGIYVKKKMKIDFKLIKPNKIYRKETLNYGIPLTFSFLLAFIISSSDRIIIQHFLDTEAVGLYTLPYEFSTFTITNVFMIINLAFFPMIIKEFEQLGSKGIKKRVEQYLSILTMLTIPTVIIIVCLAPFITGLFLGENYNTTEAIDIIKLITIAGFLSGIKAHYFDLAFHLGNKTKIQIIPVAISGILNVLLNIYLIPIYGVIGAVYGTLIAYIFGLLFSFLLGRRIMPLPIPYRALARVFVPSIILFLILYWSPFKEITWFFLILNLIIGVTVYGVLILIFNTAGIRTYLLKKADV